MMLLNWFKKLFTMVCAESLPVRAPDSYGQLSGRNLRVSRYEHPFFQMGRWLCSSTQSKSVCKIGLRDFASSVIEYSNPCSEFVGCVRETRPCSTSSFNRRVMVVEDESIDFFNSENRAGFIFLSKTINMCNDFDLVKSESNSSTRA
jgi:hypothetical protein